MHLSAHSGFIFNPISKRKTRDYRQQNPEEKKKIRLAQGQPNFLQHNHHSHGAQQVNRSESNLGRDHDVVADAERPFSSELLRLMLCCGFSPGPTSLCLSSLFFEFMHRPPNPLALLKQADASIHASRAATKNQFPRKDLIMRERTLRSTGRNQSTTYYRVMHVVFVMSEKLNFNSWRRENASPGPIV